MTILDKSDF
jgi:hypothetical protein